MADRTLFVLSVEGPEFVDKGAWTTHKVIDASYDRDLLQEIGNKMALKSEHGESIMVITPLEAK